MQRPDIRYVRQRDNQVTSRTPSPDDNDDTLRGETDDGDGETSLPSISRQNALDEHKFMMA